LLEHVAAQIRCLNRVLLNSLLLSTLLFKHVAVQTRRWLNKSLKEHMIRIRARLQARPKELFSGAPLGPATAEPTSMR
jgi:hypothetical protein